MKRFQAYYLYKQTWTGKLVNNILRNNKNRTIGYGNYVYIDISVLSSPFRLIDSVQQ